MGRLDHLLECIRSYRFWFDTCTRTLAGDWETNAAAASDALDRAIAAAEKPRLRWRKVAGSTQWYVRRRDGEIWVVAAKVITEERLLDLATRGGR